MMSSAVTILRSTLAPTALMALTLHPAQATPAIRAFQAVNAKGHQEMAIDATDDTEVDYIKSMIPSHQGAIDRCRVVLPYDNDSMIRQLANKIINDQESNIALWCAWLKERRP